MAITLDGTNGISTPDINLGGTEITATAAEINLLDGLTAIVTASSGIASNDNDTTLPTSAAVKDYADSATTTSAVLSATAGASYGAVGTYAWLAKSSFGSPITANATYAGSSLTGAAMIANLFDDADTAVNDNNATLSGTWRAMGGQTSNASDHPYNVTLFLRIS